MGNKLFVGGLSWDTTSETLRAAFENVSAVTEAIVVSDRDTGRSRGFGFVTLEDPSQMQATIEQMDGFTLDGRELRVNEANERKPPPRRY